MEYELTTPGGLGGSRLAQGVRQSIKHAKKQHMKSGKRGKKNAKPKKKKASKTSSQASISIERAGDWEFDASKLTDMKEIGSGNFGKVFIGKAHGLLKGEASSTVAVKMLTSANRDLESEFLQEAKIMQGLDGPHHIVRLLGVVTKSKPMYMIMEFMDHGDLKEVLRHSRPKTKRPATLSFMELTRMAADVAEGMSFLSSCRIVHRDLAARNCLVAKDFTVKVGDFGLTRDIYASEYYRMTGSAAMPIRWMAPECLNDGVFDYSSDVWAFGVVLWELVTFGKTPYSTMTNPQVVEAVCDEEYRLPKPISCPQELYAVMMDCWEEEPEDRPSFQQLLETLVKMIPSMSSVPIVKVGDMVSAAQIADLYSVPQDSLTVYDEPGANSADEEAHNPYSLDDIDMSSYALVSLEYVPFNDYRHILFPCPFSLPHSRSLTFSLSPSFVPLFQLHLTLHTCSNSTAPTQKKAPAPQLDQLMGDYHLATPSMAKGAADQGGEEDEDDEEEYGAGEEDGEPALYDMAAAMEELAVSEDEDSAPLYDLARGAQPAGSDASDAGASDASGYSATSTRGQSVVDRTRTVVSWLNSLTGAKVSADTLHADLKSGEVLCQAINKLRPGSVKKVHASKMAFKQMENIAHFLEACTAFGVDASSRFVTADLFEGDNMVAVTNCLAALRMLATN
eukprot:m.199363 g.199363  ORF g.199363 m.199363 type:complete len:677 (-) comp14939_c0_seq4:264-2294(-)